MTIAIYTRLSQDRTGEQAGVDRQLAECQTLAVSLGLTVDAIYSDNDVSATSGKVRPDFERLLADQPTVIITWHQDRLLRLTADLERVINLDIPIYTVAAGTLNLSTPSGRAVARTIAAWSTYEGEQKGLRQKAANRQRAEAGVWQFSRRPFGYDRIDGEVVQVEPEATALREAFAAYLRGESYYAIAEDWNARGILTPTGKPWSVTLVRERLRNPSYAGIRTYNGVEVGDGNWEPIISRVEWEELERVRKRRKTPHDWSNATRHLLSGLLTCGVCGAAMLARPEHRGGKAPRLSYACTTGWCVSRDGRQLDLLVELSVIGRLKRPDILHRLRVDADLTDIEAEVAALRGRQEDLAMLLADGTLTRDAVRVASADLQAKIDRLAGRIEKERASSALTDLALADDVAARWQSLGIMQKRSVIAGLMTITVNRQVGKRAFEPEAIDIEWTS